MLGLSSELELASPYFALCIQRAAMFTRPHMPDAAPVRVPRMPLSRAVHKRHADRQRRITEPAADRKMQNGSGVGAEGLDVGERPGTKNER